MIRRGTVNKNCVKVILRRYFPIFLNFVKVSNNKFWVKVNKIHRSSWFRREQFFIFFLEMKSLLAAYLIVSYIECAVFCTYLELSNIFTTKFRKICPSR